MPRKFEADRPLTKQILLVVLVAAFLGFHGCGAKPTEYAYKIESTYTVNDPQFQRTMGNLLGPPLVPGNKVTTLLNGDQIFPAMLAAIEAAQRTITFETFIYWQGEVGAAFTRALCERARQGVAVHLLIDAVGSTKIDEDYLKTMQEAGVDVRLYHALKWFDVGSAKKIYNRTHRKLLIVDGRVGFTGGVGIADDWLGNADDDKHWRDTHYQIEGPVVAQMQAAFLDNWMEATGEVLHDADYFPPLEPVGGWAAQMFKSSAEGGSESMHLMYLLSIASAQKSIRLATAYFIPDDLTIDMLQKARARGVRVQIILPGPEIDFQATRQASRARWGELLQDGVEIYEYMPTLYHCKLMIVDDVWTSIGSSNLDNRSFRLNDEANLNVLDAEFAAEQSKVFDDDLAKCRRITYEEWDERPLHKKLMDGIASLFGPLM